MNTGRCPSVGNQSEPQSQAQHRANAFQPAVWREDLLRRGLATPRLVRWKRRCRMHGGAPVSGAPRGNKNALKSGLYTRKGDRGTGGRARSPAPITSN